MRRFPAMPQTVSSAPAVFAPWADPQARPLIEFRGVTKRFGSFTAVDGLDLKIYEREFFALLGPSGCGKTTLMRMLAGFEEVTEGQILLEGRDLAGVPPNRRPVNMMFQSYALFPHLSVWDNIAFGLRRDRLPRDVIAERVEEMLKLVQLTRFARRKPHQISGGQKQRVALARALAKAPKLLLLDEPLGALDKKLRQETQFELMGIQEKTGTTFVIVTHDQEEAMTVASRVAVMKDGRLEQVDTPDRIYEFPANAYVADFIGEINLIEGRLAAVEGETARLHWAEGQTPLGGLAPKPAPAAGEKVTLAIRPEKVRISSERPAGAANAVRGRIEDIAYLGNISTYHVVLSTGHVLRAQTVNTDRFHAREHTWGEDVWLSWSDSAGLVLKG
jgi:putrescine transport system ATP-binding protein